MIENFETCPYCGNNVKKNAFVCAPCGAYKAEKGLSSSDRAALFFGALYWLPMGPGFLLMGMFGDGTDRLMTFLVGCAVTPLGIWVLRSMLKRASVVIWKRKF